MGEQQGAASATYIIVNIVIIIAMTAITADCFHSDIE